MTKLIQSKNWKAKGAALPKNVVIAKAKSKRVRVVSKAKAHAGAKK